jgi:hypothetical protein
MKVEDSRQTTSPTDLAGFPRLRENPRAMRKIRVEVVIGLALCGVVLAMLARSIYPPESQLLDRWRQELPSLADEQVPVRLQQIAALGDRSVPILVEALHSDRQLVADSAQTLLEQSVDQWQLLSLSDSSPRIAGLMQELARHSGQPGPHASGSTKLATRALLWPLDRKVVDGEQVVSDCETTIRAFAVRHAPDNAKSSTANREVVFAEVDSPAGGVATASPLPGGGLPIELAGAPTLPRQEVPLPREPAREPQPFVPVASRRIFGGPAETFSPRRTVQNVDAPRPTPQANPSSPSATPKPTRVAEMLKALPDLDVIRRLVDDEKSVVRLAREELTHRGFQQVHLRLAERLVDPDAEVRLQLVRSLPELAGIDSRPWLVWLSGDPAPQVRKAAIAVIGTSSDPTLRERLREIEREEADDEILRLVRRILFPNR